MRTIRVRWARVAGVALAGLVLATLIRGDRQPRPVAGPLAGEAVGTSDELVIDLVDGTALSALQEAVPELRGTDLRWNSPYSEDEAVAVVHVAPAAQPALLERLRGLSLVEAAEPNLHYGFGPEEVAGTDLIPEEKDPTPGQGYPNDPLWERQWNMRMVGAEEAWRYATGRGVIVAVLDTGVAYEDAKGLWAPDLGATGFVPGWDFVNDDPIAADDHGHGTHCAGTIAQSTHNGRGVVGLAPGCRVMPLKVLSAGGWGTTSDIADAIRYAADNGAQVLSLSLGGGGYSKVMAEAVAYATERGCAVVCAAGNGFGPPVAYPAAYPGAIAVSSVGPDGRLAPYSSYGKQVFLAAPGGNKSGRPEDGVLQNTLDPRDKKGTVYAYWQGTSMATPHVAATVALLYELGVTDPEQVRAILAASCSAPEGGWNERTGHGVLDAGRAARLAWYRDSLLPGLLSLALALPLGLVAARRTPARALARLPLAAGVLLGASGLCFLRPYGLASLPLVGGLLTRSAAEWDLVLFGPAWHWSPLFASALLPSLAGLLALPWRRARAATVGLALGWAARLAVGAFLPVGEVRAIPGFLELPWLLGNAAVLLGVAASFVRLGRSRDAVSL